MLVKKLGDYITVYVVLNNGPPFYKDSPIPLPPSLLHNYFIVYLISFTDMVVSFYYLSFLHNFIYLFFTSQAFGFIFLFKVTCLSVKVIFHLFVPRTTLDVSGFANVRPCFLHMIFLLTSSIFYGSDIVGKIFRIFL